MRPLGVFLSCLALAAAGCGDDEDEERGTGGARTRAVEVGMADIQFVPKAVKVKAGETVRWTNTDSVTHTVTKQGGPGADFDSKNMAVGATFEHSFEATGKVTYICTIHPNQTGTVTVD